MDISLFGNGDLFVGNGKWLNIADYRVCYIAVNGLVGHNELCRVCACNGSFGVAVKIGEDINCSAEFLEEQRPAQPAVFVGGKSRVVARHGRRRC